jgi:hypothetical protein
MDPRWLIVERVWERREACAACRYFVREREPHGETTVRCELLESNAAEPECCDGYDDENAKVPL